MASVGAVILARDGPSVKKRAKRVLAGVPHEEFGESIVAVVTLAPDATLDLDALREHCLTQLSRYKVPHHLTLTDQIPRNPSGKVLKHILRERTAADPQGSVPTPSPTHF